MEKEQNVGMSWKKMGGGGILDETKQRTNVNSKVVTFQGSNLSRGTVIKVKWSGRDGGIEAFGSIICKGSLSKFRFHVSHV